jgi:outer membrane protein assembly factor BamA
VAQVTIQATDGGAPGFDFTVLMDKLAHRPGNVIIPPRDFNAYRLGEDRRRIATYASNYGFFDIEVAEPVVTTGKDEKVTIDWRVEMGEKYRIGSLTVEGAPAEARQELMATIPFRGGSDVAVNEKSLWSGTTSSTRGPRRWSRASR